MSPLSARSGSGSGSRPRLVLASASPRRREILERLGIEFEAVVPDVEELQEGEPESVVLENARRKARAGLQLVGDGEGRAVLGVDTEVVLDGRVLGKPADAAQARERLTALSGRTHEVLSGVVAVLAAPAPGDTAHVGAVERSGVARTSVRFAELDGETLERYLRSGEWRDRAGGYAIQGLGSILIEAIEGDFSNVVGLPVPTLLELLQALGGE